MRRFRSHAVTELLDHPAVLNTCVFGHSGNSDGNQQPPQPLARLYLCSEREMLFPAINDGGKRLCFAVKHERCLFVIRHLLRECNCTLLSKSKNIAKMRQPTSDALHAAISRTNVFREAQSYGGTEVAVTT